MTTTDWAPLTAIHVAADAALSGPDIDEAAFEAFLSAAPWAQASPHVIEHQVVTGGPQCAGRNTAIWYPNLGNGEPTKELQVAERKRAEQLCRGCPVVAACLAMSLSVGPQGRHGVWGGVSEIDRGRLLPLWKRLQARLAELGEAEAADEAQPDRAEVA